MKINAQIKYLIASFLFFVFACFSYWFLLGKIAENKRISDEGEIAWQSESTRRYDLNSLERSLKDINKEINAFERHFVRSNDVVSFLNYIEYLGSLVGVKAQIESVDSVEEKVGTVLNLGVSTSGSFSAIYKFLMLLENSQYEIEVVDLTLNRQSASATTASPIWSGSFRIKLLSFTP